ncbi:MAG: hypothetical protein AABX03_02170 [Nanoarchaeota archaeon]
MDNWIGDCKILVKEIIDKSFPLLRNQKIFTYESKHINFSADTISLFFVSRIRISPRMRNANVSELKGLLTHELGHIEFYKKRNFVQNQWANFRCSLFKKYRELEEKNVDRLTIEKGYGKDLKANRIFREKFKDKSFEKLKGFYLTPEEIGEYMRKVKRK